VIDTTMYVEPREILERRSDVAEFGTFKDCSSGSSGNQLKTVQKASCSNRVSSVWMITLNMLILKFYTGV